MIKSNWDIFKAKFSENPQNNFEWFCYLLFCKEFNKPFGIFRYKNQSAIETNPIEKNGEIIGWQAKFYNTVLSKYKKELIITIEKAKRDYTNISKLIFYTNQEWAQNKGQESKGKIEIEEQAKDLNIELDWRTASFFESPFVSIENKIIARHFFSLNTSFFDLIEHQQEHTKNILCEIRTNITFNKQPIEIDRKNILEKLKKEKKQILILSGVAGVGKTAIIKKYYEQLKEKIPFYILKATEFELTNINALFNNSNLQDFITAHKDEKDKTIVIDSAEKLLDLKNTDPLKEFLSALIQNNWRIIFTTRDNYLEDLNYQFFEIYKIAPLNINIQNLELKELNTISEQYQFSLSKDQKLLNLIKNPFYLNEYLTFYKEDNETNYIDFKKKLWNKVIKKHNPAREQCFLEIAFERANKGQFFIKPSCETKILDDEFRRDGILGYETAGYFITHDIYEEWALEKIIEKAYTQQAGNKEFFNQIGASLPIRRSFKSWLSEKLLLEDKEIKSFIEEVIEDEEIESFWKDEILVSILLSDYSEKFFNIFKEELLENNQELLKKLTFLLRLACKEVDDGFFKQLGLKNLDLFSLEYVLTKPKGQGWKSIIKFVFENLDKIGIKNINFVMPIIHDWNSKFKEGKTTKFSGLIALQYYQWTIDEKVYFSHDGSEDKIFQTIIYGSSEVKTELTKIFEKILKNKWKYHSDPYYDLSHVILTKLEGLMVSQILPNYVLELADLFWSYTPRKDDYYNHSRPDMDNYFGLEKSLQDYFPASSYQTPIYWLLQYSLIDTINFILKFTDKTIECFSKSKFANEVKEIEVIIDENNSIKQYISDGIWNIYRGTSSPVVPYLLQSIHMALEKFFIEKGKHIDSKALESWLLYLLKNSKSASISAVVTSIVLAYPEKTFNVAYLLFKTKQFFLYDTRRLALGLGQKSSLLMLKNNFGMNYKNEIHDNERLKACDEKHRKFSLEHLFLNYQIFRSDETNEEEAAKRQELLWKILDNYYEELSDKSEETESDKIWRLFLARMDRRKMHPTTEETDAGLLLHLNPEIDPELNDYSEKSIQKSFEPFKHSALHLWASYKIEHDKKYLQYEQYEKNPKAALKEIKEIILKLKTKKRPQFLQLEHLLECNHLEDEKFYLYNYSTPAKVCSVLMRDYSENLSKKEKVFCKDIILEVASLPLKKNYQYQVSDGTQSTISVLPVLLEKFPEEREKIKVVLLLTLFNNYPIDMATTKFNAFSIIAINKLWKSHFSDAQSLLFGYLLLKSKYEALAKKLHYENLKKRSHQLHENEIIEKFFKENEADIQRFINNQLSLDDIENIEKLDLNILKTAFQLIPLKTDNKEHKEIVKKIISTFAEQLISNDRNDRIDYDVKHGFLEKLACFLLSTKKNEIQEYLKPVIDNFISSEFIADFFKEVISAQDYLNSYENFWEIWNLFKDKVIELCKDGDGYGYIDTIVKSYLFALILWEKAEWHTLKNENKRFLKKISKEIGHCPSTLYAISKLLNGIGSSYLNDGLFWISDILKNNKNLLNTKLETDTVYYLEKLIKKYIYKNREKIRKMKKLKYEVLIILNFLIEKGSVVGYMLRENVL
jgi:hypothetical protein